MLDFDDLSKKLDEMLAKTTKQDLEDWLKFDQDRMFKNIIKHASKNRLPTPEDFVIEDIKKLLDDLRSIKIIDHVVNPTCDGGIMIEYEKDNKYFCLDYDNECDIAFLIRDNETNARWCWGLTRENFRQEIINKTNNCNNL